MTALFLLAVVKIAISQMQMMALITVAMFVCCGTAASRERESLLGELFVASSLSSRRQLADNARSSYLLPSTLASLHFRKRLWSLQRSPASSEAHHSQSANYTVPVDYRELMS
jgi:hypothetical protein